jgi:hypothetical protein
MSAPTFLDRLLPWMTEHSVFLLLLVTFEATAALLLAFAGVSRQRRSQALLDKRLSRVNARLNELEANERRKIMESLNRPAASSDTTAPLTQPKDAPNLSIVPHSPDTTDFHRSLDRLKGGPGGSNRKT